MAWDIERRALLQLESRTRVPNIQEALGSYGSKRAYLPRVLAERIGVGPRGWRSVTNAIVALWSAEVIRVVRRRSQTFAAACPDPAAQLLAWWAGDRGGLPAGDSSTFVLVDPGSVRDRYRFASLEAATTARPRSTGYGDAATALEHAERDRPVRAETRLRLVEGRSGTLRS